MAATHLIHVAIYPLGKRELPKVMAAVTLAWQQPTWVRQIAEHEVYFLEMTAESGLPIGDSRVQFGERLTKAIWQKLGRYVKVSVDMASDDDIDPAREFTEFDYRKLMRVR
jgi:hypothetical protein